MANAPSYSTGYRNALLDGNDMTTLFDGGQLHVLSGSQPADADATEGAGTVLATIVLPTPAFAASAAAGAIAKAGVWQDASADATGTAAWFRMYDSAVTLGASTTAIRIDGTVGLDTGTFDLEFDSISFTITDPITVDTFSLTILLNP